MKKLLISLVMLAFVGLSGNVNAQIIVANGDCGKYGNNLTWTLTNDYVLRISGSGAMADYSLCWFDTSKMSPWSGCKQFYFSTLNINEGVTTIGKYAFAEHCCLSSVTLPSTLTSIGDSAFMYLTDSALQSVVCLATTPPSLGAGVFNSWASFYYCTLYVPPGTKSLYASSAWGTYFTNIEEFAATNLKLLTIAFQPTNPYSGDNISLVYSVESSTAVNEEWTDVVYLSADTIWTINAIELIRSKKTRNVAASAAYTDTLTCTIPAIFDGAYHLIVRCNAERLKVQESDYSDNILTAPNPINVGVEPLLINAAAKGNTLARGKQKLYKLTLTAGQSIRIADTIGIANVSIAYEQMPDIAKAQQGISYISVSKAGNYYILISNNNLDTQQVQTYSIKVTEIIGIEITNVFADTIIQYKTALIPVEIIGCSGIPQIELVGENNVHYSADTIYRFSEILFSAVFNVDSLAVGNYGIYASIGSESDLKEDAIYIIDNNPIKFLKTKIILPSVSRIGTTIIAYVEYTNSGNVDIPNLLLKLTGKTGSTYQVQVGNSMIYTNEIYLAGLNTMGVNRLRPGESNKIAVKIGIPNQSMTSATYMLFAFSDSTIIDTTPSTTTIVTSMDPNEKVGIKGTGNGDFVTNGDLMVYTIFFENDPDSATAPAQEVRITDTLDEAFDLTTFAFIGIKIGDLDISVNGTAEETILTDLRPNNDLILKTSLKMDINTRVITVAFASLDTETGEFTNDPLAGFLPVNNVSPEGEGHFTYRVNLKNNLPNDYEIKNQANIYFDSNESILTNTTSHIIDILAPTSSVLPLPAAGVKDSVLVSWSGTDAGSGVKKYDIYVSDNGSPFTIWKNKTTEISAYFHGVVGHTYAFFSIATDWIGNIEATKTNSEASVKFSSVGITETIQDASKIKIYPNPTNGQLTINNEQLTIKNVEIFDVIGQVVFTSQLSKLSPETTIDISHLSNGLYFLKIDGKVFKIIKN